jgi:hypothetical protein
VTIGASSGRVPEKIVDAGHAAFRRQRNAPNCGAGPRRRATAAGGPQRCSHLWRSLSAAGFGARSYKKIAAVIVRFRPKFQFPGFARKILAEAVMRFFAHWLEPCLDVNMSRRTKSALGPQRHFLVSCLPRESDAFLNKPLSDS